MLGDRIATVRSTNPYFPKDLAKAKRANKFIGWGSSTSSTRKYALAAGDLANGGIYSSDDAVFVSVEGGRRGRIPLNFDEIRIALIAGARIIADTKADRNRPYNVGERELVGVLLAYDYIEINGGEWIPNPAID